MHGTLEQFEDAIDKRINTDVMLITENLEDSISQRMKPSEDQH